MEYDERYQDGRNGPLRKEVRERISAFRTLGFTLAQIGEAFNLSGPFVSQLLNVETPGRIRSIHVPRIIKALEDAEAEYQEKLRDLAGKNKDLPAQPLQTQEQNRESERKIKRPKMFIASSIEQVHLAYAAQEGLEHDVEPTVWRQGVFTLSKTTIASLIEQLDVTDFGLFVFAPDDVTTMRNASTSTVRDNVILELGLFVGRLGMERCFIVTPRGAADLHLPSDLLGLTNATFEPDREDGNMVAALGPACNRIRMTVSKLGRRTRLPTQRLY